MEPLLDWNPPGPVGARFMDSRAFIQAIQGPVGGGKTSCCLVKAIFNAVLQRPSTVDGVRRFKLCVVNQDYRRLWASTIPSWWEWMPKDNGEWQGAKDGPATHVIEYDLAGHGKVVLHVDFVGIGDNRAEDVLRGYQPTAFFLNEADLLDETVFMYCLTRAGRFPRMPAGGPSWWGVLMDFNAPEADTWIEHRVVNPQDDEKNRQIKIKIMAQLAAAQQRGATIDGLIDYHCQPGAYEPGAENLHNLPPGYYDLMQIGMAQWLIDRLIHNKTGFSRRHKAVWPEYNDREHCQQEGDIAPIKGLPLFLGADAGGTPAGLVAQKMPDGQWRILDEITTDPDAFTGPTTFAAAFNELLKDRYDGFAVKKATADPSAAFGGDESDRAWLVKVSDKMKVSWWPAPTNAQTPRFDCVRDLLTTKIDGRHPALLISRRCKKLRKALGNGYRFRKRQVVGVTSYSPEVEDNEWTHVADALQYLILGGGSYSQVLGREAARANALAQAQTHAITDDDPQGTGGGGASPTAPGAPGAPWAVQQAKAIEE
ncbi:MAG: hypothetical protein U1A72_13370 [Sulfuritalea sp.]|nr:hypothetical protein [Sulfuritalea sp.]